MSAVGYASMPVVPSLQGMRAVLEKQLQGPLEAASKKAGSTLAKGLTDGVEKASRDVARARKAEIDAADAVAQAEEKVAELRDKAASKAKSVEQAELALQAARLSSDGAVEKAEQSLARLRESGTATTEELTTAERKLEQVRAAEASKVLGKENALERARQGATKATKDAEKATTDLTGTQAKLADAQDNVTAAAKRLENAQDGAGSSTSKLKMSFDDAEGAASGFAAKLGDLVKVGGGLAGIAGVGATFAEGFQASGQIDLMNAQLGLTGQAAAELGSEVRDVMRSGVAGGAEEAAAAVGALSSQFAYLGFEGEQTAGELSDNFLAFSQTFGTDMAEATQTAGQLVLNGLASDVESAADLMTAAMQRVPAAMRDELPEIMNEYGTNFRALGFSGEESFGLLVSAAEQGKFALDKTGDSLKEFTIRGADMSKASSEAYGLIGLNAEEMSAKVAAGGEGAREALMATAQGLLGVENPAERANAAIALFGTPLEDLSVDQIPQFLAGLTGAGDAMAGFQGSSQELADQVANSFQGRMDALKGTVTVLATDGFMLVWDTIQNRVIPAFQVLGQWVQDNRAWLEPLAVVVGTAAAAWGLWAGAIKTWQTVTKVATGIQAAFNAVMAANPIMLIVVALAAVAAGLTYFFMKTETGQKVWESFMGVLGEAKDFFGDIIDFGKMVVDVLFGGNFEGAPFGLEEDSALVGWLFTIRDTVLSVWEGIQSAFSVAWAFIQPIFTGFKIAFAIVLTAAMLWWEGVKLYWGLVADVIVWAWNSVIKPIWDGMQIGLQALGAFFGWVWTALIQPAWNGLGAGIAWVWHTIIRPTWDLLKAALGAVGSFFQWVWSAVIQPAWNALGTGVQWVWDSVIRPVWDGMKVGLDLLGQAFSWAWNSVIKPIWDGLGAGIRWVADSVIHPVFEGIKTGLGFIETAFSKAVDFIGSVWDTIKEKTAAPVRFVIDQVYSRGIVPVWNKVAGWLGMDDKALDVLDSKAMGFASGGVLPGYTPGRDVHKFVNPATGQGLHLSGGDAIMRPEWTRAVGGAAAVDRMNRDARSGRLPQDERGALRQAHRHALGGVLAFANGGVVGAMNAIVQQKYPGMVLTSGLRASNDNHGRGLAADFAWPGAFGPHPAQLSLANDIADTYPGSMELIYGPGFARQIKNGAIVGDGGGSYGFYAGAGDHSNHVHWAMNTPPTMPFGGGVFEGGSDGSAGGGGLSIVGGLVRSAIDTIMNPIMDAIPEGGGLIGGLGRGLGDKVFGTFKDWVLSKIPSGGGGGQYGDIDLSGVAGDNLALGQAAAEQVGWTGAEWEALKTLWTGESGWNNNAQNPTSTAYGIAQFLDSTWAPYGPKTADPAKQIEYGIRYIQDRYGTATGALSFWNAQSPHWYEQGGGLAPGLTLAANGTGKVEPVLTNPQWTMISNLVIATAELLDPIRDLARRGRDGIAHLEQIAADTRKGVQQRIDDAGAAVWAALPREVQDALTVAQAVGQQWEKVSGYLGEKAIAWSKGEWPIGSGRVIEQAAGPAWAAMHLDESLETVARSNMELAEQVIAGTVSPGSDPVANALFDIFGRDPIMPDLARIAALGPNAIGAATDAALHAFETGETARLEEWTASNSQLTEAVLRVRDAAIVTGDMVQGAVNGYLNWAMASDSQGRQGSWQEYFQHYGGEYGTAQGDWLLSQVGLGGILGGKLKDSAANLLIEVAKSPLLAAPAILDDDGRVIGSQLDRAPDVGQLDRSGYTELSPSAAGDGAPASPVGAEKSIVIEVQGTHVSVEELEKAVGALNGEVNGVKVEVKRMQNQTADVTAGVSLMV